MKLTRQLLATFLVAALSTQAFALKSDRDQPADIEADDIEFDMRKGTRTYINNVLAVQGTLRLKADKLIAVYEGSELKKATMWGSLARFKQRPDDKDHDVEGQAKRIIVDQSANTLTLIGSAALTQGPDTARGETIIYNMATDTLKVQGGAKVGTGGKDGSAPKRKIDDPFAEPVTSEEVKAGSSAGKKSNTGGDVTSKETPKKDTKTKTAESQPEPKPVKKGRSRLIINPK